MKRRRKCAPAYNSMTPRSYLYFWNVAFVETTSDQINTTLSRLLIDVFGELKQVSLEKNKIPAIIHDE